MQRVIGMDIHRTFAEVVFWETGRLQPAGRIDMTRSGVAAIRIRLWLPEPSNQMSQILS
jgi:hypothetical protein